ncbi:hypothetical protein EOPP23_04210 [Endozoicomonas sp. OPT23]|uniref:YajG family lipoprotein n=1 Tax=Endozoicomonas sp. OPT23 TaxID=2072845 RepID=UPI00129AD0CD|nr:YajG family lipoprotein [Endozoicomonas sp. OPT23]MRI32200.1 hypothetical protein [Endozoicomonas sp. OPT23]
MKKYLAILFASLLSAGCALSPQDVEVNPRITLEQPQEVIDGTVSTTVYDDRISKSLGNRGGVYGDTNAITTTNNLPLSLRSAVDLGLRELGMTVTESEDGAQFQLYLDELEYRVPEGNYITQVDLMAKIRVVVVNNGKRFKGSYTSSIQERVPTAPSDKKNEELINRVLGDVLDRAFSDSELQNFLADI